MFKGLHSALQRPRLGEATTKHPDVTIIQPASALLATEKRQQHLKNIKALLNLPPKLYDSLYYQAAAKFAEYIQALPETQHGLFAGEGGFLDHGLERASRALSLCLSYFLPQEKTLQNISSLEALWVYAVFTAALLLDVGKVAVKYQINLCHKDGTVVKEWSPYTGPMIQHAKFYRFDFLKENRDNLKRLVTSLVARQVLDIIDENQLNSISGFGWIASNPDVLESWLTILHGEKRLPMTSFMSVIPAAEAYILENYLANLPDYPSIPAAKGIFEKLPNQQQNQNFDAGKAFMNWLKDNIANGIISVNQPTADSGIHIVENGVLINPDLFARFSKEFAVQYSNPNVVKTEFMRMAEVLLESPAVVQHRYRAIQGISATNVRNYILINPALALKTGHQKQISKDIIALPVQIASLPALQQRTPQQHLSPPTPSNV